MPIASRLAPTGDLQCPGDHCGSEPARDGGLTAPPAPSATRSINGQRALIRCNKSDALTQNCYFPL
ncbi:hypothetical protein FJD35_05225 [Pseudomonas mandelii]|nr:hypothetical protein FJD35_05225 [Pseudomonas mandelii]